ncbi:FAD-dependent oxidoreductase [Halobacillus ihumii]|uniref:FAD-dependent oxidoreductase n=1 Tax=Halobacillus ihumii TaxID=2686092 RepID=UPI0013D28F56|nr:FAD-dependent oxidoreductase [Halobacillus ihumii]
MPTYSMKLLKKQKIANDTMAFHWEKPEGFEFIAGQYCKVTLVDPHKTDDQGNERAFSLVHAPYEKDVETATRMSDSAFKQVLKNMPDGTEVKFGEPHGDFTLHQDESKPAVFIIGGIGITPVRSMIAQATHDQLPHKLTLLYSNKTPADAPFMDDLKGYADENPNFTFVPVMTETKSSEWNGESGLIDAEMLKRHVSDVNVPIYYLSGPPDMVQDMRQMLVDSGVYEDYIKTEEFSGY